MAKGFERAKSTRVDGVMCDVSFGHEVLDVDDTESVLMARLGGSRWGQCE